MWYNYQKMLIPNASPERAISIDTKKISKDLNSSTAYLARWTTNFDKQKKSNFWYIICDMYDGFKFLKKSTKSEIKRGKKNCHVKIVDEEWIFKYGYEIFIEANKKYGSSSIHSSEKDYIENLKKNLKTKNLDIWSIESLDNHKKYGYAIVKKNKNSVELSVLKINPKYLYLRLSYYFLFRALEYYLKENDFNHINAGSRNILHKTNFQEFLVQKFNFRRAYCDIHIIYKKRTLIFIYLIRLISFLKFEILLTYNSKIYALFLQDKISNIIPNNEK